MTELDGYPTNSHIPASTTRAIYVAEHHLRGETQLIRRCCTSWGDGLTSRFGDCTDDRLRLRGHDANQSRLLRSHVHTPTNSSENTLSYQSTERLIDGRTWTKLEQSRSGEGFTARLLEHGSSHGFGNCHVRKCMRFSDTLSGPQLQGRRRVGGAGRCRAVRGRWWWRAGRERCRGVCGARQSVPGRRVNSAFGSPL